MYLLSMIFRHFIIINSYIFKFNFCCVLTMIPKTFNLYPLNALLIYLTKSSYMYLLNKWGNGLWLDIKSVTLLTTRRWHIPLRNNELRWDESLCQSLHIFYNQLRIEYLFHANIIVLKWSYTVYTSINSDIWCGLFNA